MFTRLLFVTLLGLSVVGCTNQDKGNGQKEEQSIGPKESIDTPNIYEWLSGHNPTGFAQKEGIEFDLNLTFGGKKRYDGTLSMATNSAWITMSIDSGTAKFDGNQICTTIAIENKKKLRFDIFTWTYFLALPYKINDPGVKLVQEQNRELSGKEFETYRMTFDAGAGDAPDDWYVLFVDGETKLIEAAAYIVTYGSSKEEAEVDPHLIYYKDFQDLAGVPIAYQWEFYAWTDSSGLGRSLGSAQLGNIQFLDKEPILEMPCNSL